MLASICVFEATVHWKTLSEEPHRGLFTSCCICCTSVLGLEYEKESFPLIIC